jgi:hypothetical protein
VLLIFCFEDPQCREDIRHLAPHLAPRKLEQFLQTGRYREEDMHNAVAAKFTEVLEQLEERTRPATAK